MYKTTKPKQQVKLGDASFQYGETDQALQKINNLKPLYFTTLDLKKKNCVVTLANSYQLFLLCHYIVLIYI